MADKQIYELPAASALAGGELFVLSQNNQAKKMDWQTIYTYIATEELVHGGIRTIAKTSTSGLNDTYTITFGDNSTTTFVVKNGNYVSTIVTYYGLSTASATQPSSWSTTVPTLTSTNKYLWTKVTFTFADATTVTTTPCVTGVYGDQGVQSYVHFKWASQQPSAESPTIGDVPDKYIGIYTGTSSTAPTTWNSYTWYKYKGETGVGITSITKTGTSGLVDTYTITYTDSTTTTFTVTNGAPATLNSTEVKYGVSATEAAQPTTWVDTMPTVAAGQYLWTRTTLTFNTGSPAVFYSKTRWGVDGTGTGTVTSVNQIEPLNGDVTTVIFGTTAPTTATEGEVKQMYVDTVAGILYVCTAVASSVYTWTQVGISSITAEDVTYDSTETYSNGTVGKELSTQSSQIEQLTSGKENKGKMTISNVERTVSTQNLVITDSGVTTTYAVLVVS